MSILNIPVLKYHICVGRGCEMIVLREVSLVE
jgi:hypothetical protein